MIKKIIVGLFFLCLFIAIPLSLAGITRVELGGSFMALMKNTSRELNDFKVAIPNIPNIPLLDKVGGFWEIVKILTNFINGFVNVLNFIVMILNYAIQLIQFLVLLVKNLILFRDSLSESEDIFPYLPNLPYNSIA